MISKSFNRKTEGSRNISGSLQYLGKFSRSSGKDGDITITGNQNLSSIISNGKQVSFSTNVSSISGNMVSVIDPSGFEIGDEVVIISVMGTSTSYSNVGNFEIERIQNIDYINKIVTLGKIERFYGSSINSNAGIGTVPGTNQIVILQRIPNFRNFTLLTGNSLTVNPFDLTKGGILAIRSTKAVISGSININGKGYPGTTNSHGYGPGGLGGFGAGKLGNLTMTAYIEGYTQGGGGGGSSAGSTGSSYNAGTSSSSYPGPGGQAFNSGIDRLFFGGAGGTAVINTGAFAPGGNGGGIILFISDLLELSNSSFSAKGNDGSYYQASYRTGYGGAGAGGTIMIQSRQIITSGTNVISSPNTPTYVNGSAGKNLVSALNNGSFSLNSTPSNLIIT